MAIDLNQPTPKTSASLELSQFSMRFGRRSKVSSKERLFFTERLALLLETGVNLHVGLQALKKQTSNPALAEIIESLITNVAEGKMFSYALARFPEVFSKTYVNLIAASENGGFIPQVLHELLEMEEKREKLRGTLLSALSYPAFLILFSLGVVIFVLAVVFPKFASLFQTIRDQLPGTTLALMWISDQLRAHWLPLSGSVMIGFVGIRRWAKGPSGSAWVDRMKLSIPLVKDIFVQLYLVQSLRVMSLSLKNGVSIVDTLAACREVVANRVYQRFISGIERNVQDGSGIAVGFSATRFIPPIVQQMITTGEETGNLPKVMARVADFYERELSKKLAALSKIAEPVLLLLMGVVVGVLVSSLILPIFKLSRAVH